jgi:hypothetical protein
MFYRPLPKEVNQQRERLPVGSFGLSGLLQNGSQTHVAELMIVDIENVVATLRQTVYFRD